MSTSLLNGGFRYIDKAASAASLGGSQQSQAGSRTASNTISSYYDGLISNTNIAPDAGIVPPIKWCSGAKASSNTTQSEYNQYTSQTETFGGSLNATQMLILHNAALTYNQSLGRRP